MSHTPQLQILHSRCQFHWSVCLCHKLEDTQAADSSHPYNSTNKNGKKVHLSPKLLFSKNPKEELWLNGLGLHAHAWTNCWGQRNEYCDWPGLDHIDHTPWPMGAWNTTQKRGLAKIEPAEELWPEQPSQTVSSRKLLPQQKKVAKYTHLFLSLS